MTTNAQKREPRVRHGTPISNYDNLLDRISSGDRFDYFAKTLAAAEHALVERDIRTVVPRGRVLNVGCGRHGTERTLFPPDRYRIVGVDVSEESLRLLNGLRTYDGVLAGSITALPFTDREFDVVYLRLILHHLVSPVNRLDAGLRECFRVLRPGGVLALVEPNSWHPVGALMNLAHALRLDMYVHGTDDDVALSPVALRRLLSAFSSRVSTHAMTYSWRRMPVGVQALLVKAHARANRLSERVPFFGHTLMMVAVKD